MIYHIVEWSGQEWVDLELIEDLNMAFSIKFFLEKAYPRNKYAIYDQMGLKID